MIYVVSGTYPIVSYTGRNDAAEFLWFSTKGNRPLIAAWTYVR
jgi:hypothetical protein